MAYAALYAWASGVLLVSVRLAMLFIATPVFGAIPIPAMARVILIVGLAAGMAASLHVVVPQPLDLMWLASALMCEVVIGAAMAAALFAGFGAFHFGGRLLDFQVGYGIAGLVDIATKNNMPLIGSVFSMMALLLFFIVDGHLLMLRVLHLSFTALPIGAGLSGLDIGAVIAYFSTCFVLGFVIVAPVVLCLFLIDIGMAFMSRTMPQMNVFVMSLSLKVVAALVMLAMIVPFSAGAIQMIFESIFNQWKRLLA